MELGDKYLLPRRAVRLFSFLPGNYTPLIGQTLFDDHGIFSVGVGFSYADYGETVGTTEEAALNVYAFISIFFETFSQFKGRPLHLSGESYGVSHVLSPYCAVSE